MPIPRISVVNKSDERLEIRTTPLLGGSYGMVVVLPIAGDISSVDARQFAIEAAANLRQLAAELEVPLRNNYAAIARRARLRLVAPVEEGTD